MAIHRIPTPSNRDAEPHPLVHALAEVERRCLRAEYGHDDFADTARAFAVRLLGSPDSTTTAWLALPDRTDPEPCAPADALGSARLTLFHTEDQHLALVTVATHPDHRGRGLGRALWEAVLPNLVASGRTTWFTGIFYPGPEASGPDAVLAKSGSGAVDGSWPLSQWLQRDGWELEQCERPATLVLGEGVLQRAAALQAEAADAAGRAYELVQWVGRTPEEFLTSMAELNGRMSVDVPTAGLEFEEQVWDADRLRQLEDRAAAAGYRLVTTAVRHRASGGLVAYSQLEWPAEQPEGVWQENTIVHGDHRGHRLGQLVKAANLLHLRSVNPTAQRVHTWNASENRWMLAINDALGFEPIGLEGIWQKKL